MEESYIDNRHRIYRINEDDIDTGVCKMEPVGEGEFIPVVHQAKWFEETKDGDIRILYKTLDNRHLELHVEGKKYSQKIFRTCLSTKSRKRFKELTGKKTKYLQPKGTGSIIFHTQGVIDAYLNEQRVRTLYLVEGEYKAFCAWKESLKWVPTKKQIENEPNLPPDTGLPIMGIGGKDNFKDEDGELARDILEFIRVCRPENIVLILDNDFRNLPSSYNPEKNPDVDLGKRLHDFYNATIKFRELTKGRCKDVYLVTLSEDLQKETIPETDISVKGLDDLLASELLRPDLVLYHLVKSIRPGTRQNEFESLNLTTSGATDIRKHFLLKYSKNGGGPKMFYLRHEETIGDKEFVFNGNKYAWNEKNDALELTIHVDSSDYIRVGPKYFKIFTSPDAYGNRIRNLEPWSPAEIKRDYVDGQGQKNFFATIRKYNKFVNIPENDPAKYQQVVDGCYNLYYPVDYTLDKRPWPKIEMYLRHIFKDQYDVALDWIHLSFTNPTQKLPAICLVSKEKSTGKSKFIELMMELYQDNAVMIGNQEITDRFNDDYVTKNIIGIDEGIIEKKQVIEKLKSWITGRYVQMDTKNVSRTRIDMFAKVIMTSNNVDDFIRIDDDENRFWVVYVNPYEGEEIPDLIDQMSREINGFAHYLKKEHKIKYKKRTRLWFKPAVYETDALQSLRKESKSQLFKNIEIAIAEEFIKYNVNPDQKDKFTRLYYSITEVTELVLGKNAHSERQYVKKVLQKDYNIGSSIPTKAVYMPERTIGRDDSDMYQPGKAQSKRAVTFRIEDFLQKEDIEQLGITEDMYGYEPQDELPF